jgi:hypothetical protein
MPIQVPLDPASFAVAAQLANVTVADILRVTMTPSEIIVLLVTGQKFHFTHEQADTVVRAQLFGDPNNPKGGRGSVTPLEEPPARAVAAAKRIGARKKK